MKEIQKIKVLYESSNLGVGHIDSKSRAGIFRYAESLLTKISLNPNIDAKYTAYTNFYNSIFLEQYCNEVNPQWTDQIINSYSSKLKIAEIYIETLNDIRKNEARDLKNRAKRKLQATFLRILGSLAQPSKIKEKFDIYHSLYYQFPRSDQICVKTKIITIYDMIPVLMPQYFNKGFDKEFSKIISSIDIYTDWVIAISESTKKDFCNITKMSENRVFVTPLASNSKFYQEKDKLKIYNTQQNYSIPAGKYFLGLSTLEPRKNTQTLIRCFYKLLSEKKIDEVYLVLAGSKGWLFDDIFKTAESRPDLLNRIIFTGYIQDEDLSAIYSGATCFVYPSFYEGFGLPPLEAMQCGVPVITSNTSSLPEVVGDAGILIDPKDEDQLCQAMLNVLNDSNLRATLSQKGLERAKQFSWKKCADQTVEIYKKILDSK